MHSSFRLLSHLGPFDKLRIDWDSMKFHEASDRYLIDYRRLVAADERYPCRFLLFDQSISFPRLARSGTAHTLSAMCIQWDDDWTIASMTINWHPPSTLYQPARHSTKIQDPNVDSVTDSPTASCRPTAWINPYMRYFCDRNSG